MVSLILLLVFAFAAIVFWIAATSMQRKRYARETAAVVGGDFAAYLLEVLANAAKIDGRIDEAERHAAVRVMSDATGAAFERAKVDTAIEVARLNHAQLLAYLQERSAAFSTEQKLLLLKGVLSVAAADGRFDQREHDAYLAYFEAVGFSRKSAPQMLQEMIEASVQQRYI